MSSRWPPNVPGGGDLPGLPDLPGRGRDEEDHQGRLPGDDDPVVLLDSELDDGKVWLVLANPGERTAFEVKVDFAGPLKGPGGQEELTEKRIFRGLPMLRPRSSIRILVDTAHQLFARQDGDEEDDDGRQKRIPVQARVSWRSRRGRAFSQTFRHDLAIWEDLGEVG